MRYLYPALFGLTAGAASLVWLTLTVLTLLDQSLFRPLHSWEIAAYILVWGVLSVLGTRAGYLPLDRPRYLAALLFGLLVGPVSLRGLFQLGAFHFSFLPGLPAYGLWLVPPVLLGWPLAALLWAGGTTWRRRAAVLLLLLAVGLPAIVAFLNRPDFSTIRA